MQIGCDPKRDSLSTLCGRLMPTIMDQTRKAQKFTQESIEKVVFTGYNGVLGCESGGPRPGAGCAGKGVNLALQLLDKYKTLEKHEVTFVIYDVLGDVVCGGFAQPMRAGYAKEIYLVTCGETLTLYQVNNIGRAVVKLHDGGAEVGVAGLINNMRGVLHEQEIIEEFARELGLPVIYHIPRSKTVQKAEFQGKTTIEAYPESEQARVYRELAGKILANRKTHIPKTTNHEADKGNHSLFLVG